jgi:hypothetical protein
MYGAHCSVVAEQLPVAQVPASVCTASPGLQDCGEHWVAAG